MHRFVLLLATTLVAVVAPSAATAADPAEIALTIEENRFQPEEVRVKAGAPFVLVITNRDKTAEEVESRQHPDGDRRHAALRPPAGPRSRPRRRRRHLRRRRPPHLARLVDEPARAGSPRRRPAARGGGGGDAPALRPGPHRVHRGLPRRRRDRPLSLGARVADGGGRELGPARRRRARRRDGGGARPGGVPRRGRPPPEAPP